MHFDYCIYAQICYNSIKRKAMEYRVCGMVELLKSIESLKEFPPFHHKKNKKTIDKIKNINYNSIRK